MIQLFGTEMAMSCGCANHLHRPWARPCHALGRASCRSRSRSFLGSAWLRLLGGVIDDACLKQRQTGHASGATRMKTGPDLSSHCAAEAIVAALAGVALLLRHHRRVRSSGGDLRLCVCSLHWPYMIFRAPRPRRHGDDSRSGHPRTHPVRASRSASTSSFRRSPSGSRCSWPSSRACG